MQVSLENVGQFERRLTVRIPTEQLEKRVQARLDELSRTVRLKGFRPGRIPAAVLEQKFGTETRKKAYSELISSSYQEALRQQNLRPAIPPSITAQPLSNSEISYTATFEVMPELPKIDVAGLRITKLRSSVEDSDIDRMIETLRAQRQQWHSVNRPSKDGDAVIFEYSMQAGDQRFPKQGMEKAVAVLGASNWFPAFEEQLRDASAGQVREVSLELPDSFQEPALAGKRVDAHISILRVQEPKLPEVDDAFMVSFGVREGGINRFRADVRSNLEREMQAAIRAHARTETVRKLVEAHTTLEVPQGMVQNEAKALLERAKHQAGRVGAQPPSDESLFTQDAQQRVRAFVLLAEIARQNAIVPDQARMRDMLVSIASTYEEPEKVIELYNRDPEMMASLRNRVMEDQVVDWVVSHAQAEERTLPFNELIQQAHAAAN